MYETQTKRFYQMGFVVAMILSTPLVWADGNLRKSPSPSTGATSSTSKSATSEELARQLFNEGLEYRAAGNVEKACASFSASYRAFPKKTSAFQLANCWEEEGRTRSAQKIFVEVAKISNREGDIAGANEALERARALDARHSTIVVNVSVEAMRIPGLSIRLDDTLVIPTDWNKTRHAVDAGIHTITALAPGHSKYEHRVRIGKETTARHVDVPALEANEYIVGLDSQLKARDAAPNYKAWGLIAGGGVAFLVGWGTLAAREAERNELSGSALDVLAITTGGFIFGGLGVLGWGIDVHQTRTSLIKKIAFSSRTAPTSLRFAVTGQF